ncbi:MAG: hypothetical protein ABIR78_03720 [Ferruginibacter sp.]
MESENFSPKDSLLLIDSMINQAKNRFSENGFLYLLWGWLILFCSIAHFVILKLQLFKHPEVIWASCWLAVIFQVIYLVRTKKKEIVKTYSEEIINYIWISFGISMFILSFILGKSQGWEYLYSLFLLLYGIPTFLSGVVMQFKPLKTGGITCWVLAIISTFILPVYGLLLLAVAMIVAWIVPGYLLRKKYNQQNKA